MDEARPSTSDEIAARLGRISGRLVRQAKPRVKRMASDAKPLVDKATQYAIDHQDELKAMGTKAMRAKFRGPLGMALDAFSNAAASGATSAPKDPVSPKCARCGTENPKGSRFCNQCALPLSDQ